MGALPARRDLYGTCGRGAPKNVEIVGRALADAVLNRQRDWNSTGGIRANSRRGWAVVSPEKLVDGFATHRNLHAEVDFPLSGSTAAMHYLGSRNAVANLGRRIVYTTRALSPGDFPAGDEVIV